MASPPGFGESDATTPTTTALCAACQTINIPNLTRELDVLPDWWEQTNGQSNPRGMVHLPDARELPQSAASCSMCQLMLCVILEECGKHTPPDAVQHRNDSPAHRTTSQEDLSRGSPQRYTSAGMSDVLRERDIAQLQQDLIDSPIYLRPAVPRDGPPPAFPGEEVAGAAYVYGIRVLVPIEHGFMLGHVRLFALPDTPAALSCDIIGRPPLPSSDSPEAYSLINRWMSDCLAKHDACKEALSKAEIDESSPPILPTRIIHVGSPNEAICPRLIETNGETGHYVALSHCWGNPADSPPLMTTQTTLKSYITGIPWEALPRTYQDAISATHRLGFEYIWIDSLCIVQDSDADCLHELSRKGAVFQSARLAIAASHATNTSEPCFYQRPELPPDIELKHVSRTDEPEGSIFAGFTPNDNSWVLLEHSPLASHANATEELLMSRRIIFYTPSNLIWSCRKINQHETGSSFHTTCRNPLWRVVVEKHAARLFTKPSDRLTALEGVRSEVGKKREGSVYCLGLWHHDMPMHLLWYCLKPARRAKSGINLPTWTWASTMCSILFNNLSGITRAPKRCIKLRFDEGSKTLATGGALKRIPKLAPFTGQQEWKNATAEEVLAPLEALHGTPPDNQKRYILGEDGAVIGWALLDEPDTPNIGLRCILLMKKTLSKKNTTGAMSRRLYREWVLLVPGSEDDMGRFQRVGMGVITTVEPWFGDQATTQIYLA